MATGSQVKVKIIQDGCHGSPAPSPCSRTYHHPCTVGAVLHRPHHRRGLLRRRLHRSRLHLRGLPAGVRALHLPRVLHPRPAGAALGHAAGGRPHRGRLLGEGVLSRAGPLRRHVHRPGAGGRRPGVPAHLLAAHGRRVVRARAGGHGLLHRRLRQPVFRSEPPLPPSVAQARQRGGGPGADFGGSLRRLLANSSYRLHLLAYGINVGMYNTLCTVLGQLVVNSFQNEEVFAGRVGLIIVLVGTFGSMAFGYILDKTHKYKETSLAIYVFTLLGWIAFSLSVQSQSHVLVYISATLLGWFMGGYMPVGFEVGAELTYPEPEGTATGLLFIPPSLLGLLFTLLLGQLTAVLGDLWACLALSSFLVVGCGLTAAMRRDYRRLAANRGDSPQDGKPAGTTKL
ncbi:heme transporter FLVCR2-like isoform X4 [Bacillus rossius redtenbacheri]|uniref:heme transporter FLVCR2-like isoform X4 n=1 Tax=Bacillus rossius redtenbacheri TaxID=93214 RepID=UPI002FDCDC2F